MQDVDKEKQGEPGPAEAEETPEAAPEDAAAAEAAAEPTEAEGPLAEPAPAPEATESSPEAQIAALKDRLLRTLAEMENLRRRAQRDREDATKYAVSNFARDMLAVADNLRRAIESVPEGLGGGDEGVAALIEGVELTERELLAALERHGISRIDPAGEKFNHDLHEAMFEVPTDDAAPGTVVQVLEPGYVIHDRLLRPARVGVAKALPSAQGHVDTTV